MKYVSYLCELAHLFLPRIYVISRSLSLFLFVCSFCFLFVLSLSLSPVSLSLSLFSLHKNQPQPAQPQLTLRSAHTPIRHLIDRMVFSDS